MHNSFYGISDENLNYLLKVSSFESMTLARKALIDRSHHSKSLMISRNIYSNGMHDCS